MSLNIVRYILNISDWFNGFVTMTLWLPFAYLFATVGNFDFGIHALQSVYEGYSPNQVDNTYKLPMPGTTNDLCSEIVKEVYLDLPFPKDGHISKRMDYTAYPYYNDIQLGWDSNLPEGEKKKEPKPDAMVIDIDFGDDEETEEKSRYD